MSSYYSLASNFTKLEYFANLMERSCLKTIAGKHKTTTRKIRRKYQVGKTWGIPFETAQGTELCRFAHFKDCKNPGSFDEATLDCIPQHGAFRAVLNRPAVRKNR